MTEAATWKLAQCMRPFPDVVSATIRQADGAALRALTSGAGDGLVECCHDTFDFVRVRAIECALLAAGRG